VDSEFHIVEARREKWIHTEKLEFATKKYFFSFSSTIRSEFLTILYYKMKRNKSQ